ncbi:MAG: hypothetical protein OES57_00885 [Acidimicrobiia bacterium]|nr:hypothetical protein [Acidimicrobiia bacterium]
MSVPGLPERELPARLDALFDAGHLAEGMRVVIHGTVLEDDLHQAHRVELEARGVEIVADTQRSELTDQDAAAAEVAVFSEAWIDADPDALVVTSSVAAADTVGVDGGEALPFAVVWPQEPDRPPALLITALGASVEAFEPMVTVLGEADLVTLYETGINGVAECVDRFEASSGEEVRISTETEGVANLPAAVFACQAVEAFVVIADAAGAELTRESFAAALAELGPIEITAHSAASGGKPDLADLSPVVARLDPQTQTFVPE